MQIGAEMAHCLQGELPKALGVAVSGGSDSTALLQLLADWSHSKDVVLYAATVNHGLRPEAPAEAEQVAKLCHRLNIAHQTLLWTGDKSSGNLQQNARHARQNLLAGWAAEHQIGAIALGHTADDQAETVLMRLMRGSGVDGLAAMSAMRTHVGVRWIRPLLHLYREDLRAYLVSQNIPWSDDPSNQDDRFERVQTRKAIKALGLSVSGLVDTAKRLQETRQYLEIETQNKALELAEVTSAGDVILKKDRFLAQPLELRQRLLSHCLKWVSSSAYRPRFTALKAALEHISASQKSTLLGCEIDSRKRGQIRISREYQAVRSKKAETDEIWDARWHVSHPENPAEHHIAALGENGMSQCPDWRETGLPRNTLLASPAIWQGSDLVAAPLAGFCQGWAVKLAHGANSFFSSIVTH